MYLQCVIKINIDNLLFHIVANNLFLRVVTKLLQAWIEKLTESFYFKSKFLLFLKLCGKNSANEVDTKLFFSSFCITSLLHFLSTIIDIIYLDKNKFVWKYHNMRWLKTNSYCKSFTLALFLSFILLKAIIDW